MNRIERRTVLSGALTLEATALAKIAVAQNSMRPLVAETSRVLPAATTNYIRNDKPADFHGLAGSALLSGKQLTLTAVNPDLVNARETEIAVGGARIGACMARVLSAADVHTHNSFENPQVIEPRDVPANVGPGGSLVFRFAPASVTGLQIGLV